MQKILVLLTGAVILSLSAMCQQDVSKLKGPRPVINLAAVPEKAYSKGVINIKFNPSVEALLQIHPAISADGFISFGIPAVDALNKQYNVSQAMIGFRSLLVAANATKTVSGFEQPHFSDKHKQWGFHLWYQLKFPANVDIKEIVAKYQQLQGIIDVAEPLYKVEMISDHFDNKKTNAPDFIPNDARFNQQWNFLNTGQANGTPGSDIHLTQAWDIATGDSNVIVAVDDGGIQIGHPDIAANMWPGIGFNFVDNNQIIDPSEHATHTSGTVGAVNNNGIGVSGIAGGNGNPGSGIHLMTMEVFGPDTTNAPNFGEPFIWSADHGAAISQNSWGYKDAGVYDQEVLDGIDYFVANGGGTVLQGGLVVFSAGNDNSDGDKYPAFYSKTIAVAATNNNDVRSYYSNYGPWVDICAPGGEQFFDGDPGGVLSTNFNSGYEFLQGTSMAAPHVSGVAALIISKAPGLLTADSLRSILLENVDDIYPLNDPLYAGQLGTGRLDAFKCLQRAAEIANLNDLDAKVSQFIIPTPGINVCSGSDLIPTIKIVNLGKHALTTLQVGVILDGTAITPLNSWTGNLHTFNDTVVALAPISGLSPGIHSLAVFTLNPNDSTDQNPANDTAFITFNVQQTIALPAVQDFEPDTASMPPTGGWALINPDNGITWDKSLNTIGADGNNTSCMWMNAAAYTTPSAVDIFTTPKIDITGIDTVKLSFDLSYGQWATTLIDTLEVVYSPDCGATWLPTGYKKWGHTLSTIGNVQLQTDYFPAQASDWKNDKINIPTCGILSPSILIGIKWTNGFGNNCFIDNINLDKAISYHTNAAVVSIDQPSSVLCINTFTPQVTIANDGLDVLTSVNINYVIDNGTVTTFKWTGNLPKCASTQVTLAAVNITYQNHILKVYTDNPNGLADEFTVNDTLSQQVDASPLVSLPVTEGFESDSFPPTNWSVLNPDKGITWQRSTDAHRSGNGALLISNFNYGLSNTVDKFFSPVIANEGAADSLFASFDLSYEPGASYPGSTALPLDTLEVQVTTDCGATFKTVWKKWGEDLQTVDSPNFAKAIEFFPTTTTQWNTINVYLSPYLGSSNFQVFFVAKSNHQNDLWIDNINIHAKNLPPLVKRDGYLIYPNPFVNTFEIQHLFTPVNLKAVQVYNSVGQLVWGKNYAGNASREIFVDLGHFASGMYFVNLTYTDKTIVQKIVKQ